MMSSLLDLASISGIQGGPLEHIIAAKAVSFCRSLRPIIQRISNSCEEECFRMAQAFYRQWV